MDDIDQFELALKRRRIRNLSLLAGVGIIAVGVVVYRYWTELSEREALRARQAQDSEVFDQLRRTGAETPEERQALAAALDRIERRAQQVDAAFHAGMEQAFAKEIKMSGPCPVTLPGAGPGLDYARTELGSDEVPPSRFKQHIDEAAPREREVLEDGFYPHGIDRLPTVDDPAMRYEVVLRVLKYTAPTVETGSVHHGNIQGVAYLWDHVEGKMVCGALVYATSVMDVDEEDIITESDTMRVVRTQRQDEDLVESLEDSLLERAGVEIRRGLMAATIDGAAP